MCSPSALAMVKSGRAIPSPEVTKLMYSLLSLGPSDKLLEIGTGSASQTQEWAKSGCELHTVELEPVVDPERLGSHGLEQVYAHLGDGKKGLPQEAPFTAIVATCGVKSIPESWIEQLSPEGRLVAPIGNAEAQKLTLFRKSNGSLVPQRVAAYTRFQMMV